MGEKWNPCQTLVGEHQEDQDIGRWIILRWTLRDRMGDMAQDRGQWTALVIPVMKLQVP
jgi:hypothetical protein